MTCYMSCHREEKHSAKTGNKETMDLFATFYLFFEFRQNLDFALVFGFKN